MGINPLFQCRNMLCDHVVYMCPSLSDGLLLRDKEAERWWHLPSVMRSSDGKSLGIPICWPYLQSCNYCPSAKACVQNCPEITPRKWKRSSLHWVYCFICNCGCVCSHVPCHPALFPQLFPSWAKCWAYCSNSDIKQFALKHTSASLIKSFFHRPTMR